MSTEYELNDTSVEDWITDNVSFLQANVTLYRNPAIYAEYQPVLDQIKSLEAALAPKRKSRQERSLGEESLGEEVVGEESLGEDDLTLEMRKRLDALYTEAERLWKSYTEDVEVWTLRRLDEHEVREERKGMELPLPKQPKKLPEKASPSAQAAHAQKYEDFITQMVEYTEELNLRCLQIAVLKVVVKGVVKPAPSLEGLRRLKARPGGADHIRELISSLENLTAEGVNIMAPHRSGAGA